jgi:propionyl-CoA carboxylase alpha chain
MNTRLQVEHPVTELVYGVDLVAMQLGAEARPGVSEGHAIEARLYAEDPAADYRPQSGVLTRFEIPEGDGIRVDAGYESGSTVSTFYDAMLAKVVCHAPTREAAARKLADTLARARIHGVTTNRDQLVAALRSDAFLAGEVSTAFLTPSGGRAARAARRGRVETECRRCRDRPRRTGRSRTHRPARHPHRLAQRTEPAAAHGVRRRDGRRVVARP